jgi:hypothetical protein
MSSWQVEVSRSMADWARSGSVMRGSHSLASRLEVTTVAFGDDFVEVGGLGGGQGLEGEIVDLSGVRTIFCHVSAGGDVWDASATWRCHARKGSLCRPRPGLSWGVAVSGCR